MNPVAHAARLGLSRGWIEFRQQITSPQDLGFTVFSTVAVVVVMWFQREATLPGTSYSLAAATLPGVLGLAIPFNAMFGAVGSLAVEREDGTLLRAKALPQGMVGYLVGRVVALSLTTVSSMLIIVVAGILLLPALAGVGPGGWLAVAGLTVLGLLFSLPLGAIVGAMASNPQTAAGLALITTGGLVAVSGVFYPITALAGWLQTVAQIFPIYWLGLGMRAAMLPDAAAVAEVGGSWRPVETVLVLAAWAAAALVAAPPILRRMARRESGSMMEARRRRAMQRIG